MKLLLFTCVFLHGMFVTALSQELVRQVSASMGHSGMVGYTVFQYTIGEPLVTTLAAGDLLLTQGFQQPEVVSPNKAPEAPFVSDFIVFPNPASEKVNLAFDLLQDGRVVFMLVNNAGQVVFSTATNMLAGRVTYALPVSGYAVGLYYLVIRTGYRTYTEKLVIQ